MAIFTQGVLTKKGQALIAKCEASGDGISITKVKTGSGVHNNVSAETLEQFTALIHEEQSFGISDLATIEGNNGVAVITAVLNNRGLTQLYYLNELGVYAEDPDEGEILYLLLVTETNSMYMPPENSSGISTITERIYVEVTNAQRTTINYDGAVVSATEFIALRQIVNSVIQHLTGGTAGQMLYKTGSEDYAYEWDDSNVITDSYANFPEEGRSDAVYIDRDSSEIYVWKVINSGTGEMGYFKLPLGAEASQTLQSQITTNANNIAALTTKLHETVVTVTANGWVQGTQDDEVIFTNEITVSGMTSNVALNVYPVTQADTIQGIEAEKKAANMFCGRGIAESATGKIVLTIPKKKPAVDFGLGFTGV
ncbi:hypothetical protein BXO88_09895 [Oribacterium sp. C9]|uniref:phage tail-collar fiber domain-containing protein n=1 Tax=Oribacterium sp. C9 TaxID=1943579 RepID=UPI00098FCE62|nr:phage tail protein [Oribacterium sp. C9]OON85928.1 hypothetical protein BXO88_09895 [Oribacterium sp. C9]